MESLAQKPGFKALLARGGLLLLLWWTLSDGNAQSWWVGVPAVVVAVIASRSLLPQVTLAWWEVAKFAPVFLWRSVQGGVDVALRAMDPRMPISPEFVQYRLRLPPGLPRVAFVNIMSLLPGTLSASLDGDLLQVHILDGEGDFLAELDALEQRVARLSGMSLTTASNGE